MSLHSNSSNTTPQHEHAEIAGLGTTVCGSRGLALAGSFRQILAGTSVAGPARLVSCPSGDNRAVRAAIEPIWPGEVLIIAMPDPNNSGIIGGFLATPMQHRGAAGVVVDGSVRDAAQLHELGLPVWAGGVAVPATTKSGSEDTTEVVVVGEAQIKAADIVIADADADAVVIADSGDAASVLGTGRQRDRHEAELRAAIAAKATTIDLLGLGS
jgi:4-hydroxy-4-methyl-2-oxoglutarate aldolase